EPPKVVVITGREARQYALQAIDMGAYDYFCKPVDADELKAVLKRAVHVQQIEQESRDLQRSRQRQGFEEMLGTSPAIQDVFAGVRKVAPTEAPVLVLGESGTGKDLVARAIHRLSSRRR